MVLPKLQAEATPENITISNIILNVQKLSEGQNREELITKQAKNALEVFSRHEDEGHLAKAKALLIEYTKELNEVWHVVEQARKSAHTEQLKILGKINSLEPIIANIIQKIRSLGNYPFRPKDAQDLEKIKQAHREVALLPQKIKAGLDKSFAEAVRDEKGSERLAKGAMPRKAAPMFLSPERKYRERKAAEERIYYLDEQGFQNHLRLLLSQFSERLEKLEQRFQAPFQTVDKDALEKERAMEEMARLLFGIVFDIRKLIDYYQRHFRSTSYLDLNLAIKDAEILRELDSIVELLRKIGPEKYPELLPFYKTLREKRAQIQIYSNYDYEQEKYVDRSILANIDRFLKEANVHTKDVEFKSQARAKISNRKFTIPGARGWIRSQAFFLDRKRWPTSAVIIVPGFTAYRQLIYNIAEFLAADGYLGVVMDIASQGESRGKYGYAEGTQNVLMLAKYLKTLGIQRCVVFGASVSGPVVLYSLLYYDLAVDEIARRFRNESANFWENMSLSMKTAQDAKKLVSTFIETRSASWRKELREALLASYYEYHGLIAGVGVLNPLMVEVPAILQQVEDVPLNKLHWTLNLPLLGSLFGKMKIPEVSFTSPLLYSLMSSEKGGKVFKGALASSKNMVPYEETTTLTHKKAFERLPKILNARLDRLEKLMKESEQALRKIDSLKKELDPKDTTMIRVSIEREINELSKKLLAPEQLQDIKAQYHETQEKLQRIFETKTFFASGLAILDRDHFFREIAYAITPPHLINLIQEVAPELLDDARAKPKLFVLTTEDEMFSFAKSSKLVKQYAKVLHNCNSVTLQGVNHVADYPGIKMREGTPVDMTFLNELRVCLHKYLGMPKVF